MSSATVPRPSSPRTRFITPALRDRSARIGLVITLVFILLTVTASFPAPYDPYDQDLSSALSSPAPDHWFGTDQSGRDMLSRVMSGTRGALFAVVAAEGLALLAGCALGLLAGFFAGAIDAVLIRLMDVLLAFPYLLLALIIVAALGPGLTNSLIAANEGS